MNSTDDPIEVHLRELAQNTVAAAPRPAPPGVIRMLAERRQRARASRRLLTLLAVACAAPLLFIITALALRPADSGDPVFAVTIGVLALALVVGGVTGFSRMQAGA